MSYVNSHDILTHSKVQRTENISIPLHLTQSKFKSKFMTYIIAAIPSLRFGCQAVAVSCLCVTFRSPNFTRGKQTMNESIKSAAIEQNKSICVNPFIFNAIDVTISSIPDDNIKQ